MSPLQLQPLTRLVPKCCCEDDSHLGRDSRIPVDDLGDSLPRATRDHGELFLTPAVLIEQRAKRLAWRAVFPEDTHRESVYIATAKM
jgi:hypothetical protein